MSKLEADLESESLCKTHIFNFKNAVFQPIRVFHFLGNFQKIQKNTKIQQKSKNVKCNHLSILHRYELILSEIELDERVSGSIEF